MRYLLFFLVLLYASTCAAFGVGTTGQIGCNTTYGGGGGFTCGATPVSSQTAGTSADTICRGDSENWGGFQYTPTTSQSICRVTIPIRSVVTNTTITDKTYRLSIYSLSGNNLDVELGYEEIPGDDTWSYTEMMDFVFVTPVAVTSGVTYGVAISIPAGNDTINYVNIAYTTIGASGNSRMIWRDDKTPLYGPVANNEMRYNVYVTE